MKSKSLGELEHQVMNIVWDCGNCSVRDVLEKISKKKKLAYTTIATILDRLNDKGLVKREKQSSLIHYSPKVSKEDYGKSTATDFLHKFLASFGDTSIASFAGSIDKLPKEKKKYLLKLLQKK